MGDENATWGKIKGELAYQYSHEHWEVGQTNSVCNT